MFHHKPWHEWTFRLDLVLCLETRSIAELDILCERAHEVEHVRLLTRQVQGSQITEFDFVGGTPTKDVHNTTDEDSSMFCTGRRNEPSAL
jgi:hypothetical protein